jgi:hypothetical protein
VLVLKLRAEQAAGAAAAAAAAAGTQVLLQEQLEQQAAAAAAAADLAVLPAVARGLPTPAVPTPATADSAYLADSGRPSAAQPGPSAQLAQLLLGQVQTQAHPGPKADRRGGHLAHQGAETYPLGRVALLAHLGQELARLVAPSQKGDPLLPFPPRVPRGQR